MLDRLAADGTFPTLQPSPDISVQYPLQCALRQQWNDLPHDWRRDFTFHTEKTSLFRVRTRRHGALRFLRNPHFVTVDGMPELSVTGATCPSIGMYAHYTLTSDAIDALRRKVAMRVQEALRARRGEAGAASSNSSAPCNVVKKDTRHRPCPDYEGQLTFVNVQMRNPSRELYPLCHPAEKL